jgi:hypothetical protein
MSRLTPFLIAAVVVAVGCGANTDPAEPELWALEPSLEIGPADSGPQSFSDVRGFGVDGQGRMFLFDAAEQQIRVFDSTGNAVMQLGRRGDGPGEFREANGISVQENGRVWAYDPILNRVTLFDSSGALARTYVHGIPSYGFLWSGAVDSLGRVYDEQYLEQNDSTPVQYLRRSDLATARSDTLRYPTCDSNLPVTFQYPRGVMRVPFASGRYLDSDARGFLWCADTREVRIVQRSFDDSLSVKVLTAPSEPMAVTTAERDSVIRVATKFMEVAGKADLDFAKIPTTKPVLQSIDLDDEGRVWVRTLTREGLSALVFDTTGTLLGKVRFPWAPIEWSPTVVRKRNVYLLMADSLDVPYLSRLRLVEKR